MEAEKETTAEEPYKKAKTSVWWVMDQCKVPVDSTFDPTTIAANITSALFNLNLYGPITILAYGDIQRIPNSIRKTLISTGIILNQLPSSPSGSGSGASNANILVDMLLWAVDNPPPANYLLISGDSDFSYIVQQLKIRSYNILLAQPHDASLVASAKSVLSWSRILAGGPSLKNGNDGDKGFNNISRASSVKVVTTTCPQTKKYDIAPHEFFTASKRVSCTTQNPIPSVPLNGNTQIDSAPDKMLRQNKPTVQPNFAPDKFFQKDPPLVENGPTVSSGFVGPDNTSNPFSHQLNGNSNQNLDLGNHGSKENEYQHLGLVSPQEPSVLPSTDLVFSNRGWGAPEYLQGLVGFVLLALHTLKCEKIIPTEANISDCILYGDPPQQKFDLRMALHYGLEQQMITRLTVGATDIYIGKNTRLWNCVNPLGGNHNQYSKAMWNELQHYLSSPDGQFKMSASECRYEAAMYLKKSCLKNYALGEALQILNMIIELKKWIIPHPSGWQPIIITAAK